MKRKSISQIGGILFINCTFAALRIDFVSPISLYYSTHMHVPTNIGSNYHIFDLLIENNTRFALYCLPNTHTIVLVLQTTEQSYKTYSIDELSSSLGFVIAPFCASKAQPIVCIHPDIKLENEEAIFSFLNNYQPLYHKPTSAQEEEGIDNTDGQYSTAFDLFINKLRDNSHMSKLVLSRTLTQTRSASFSAGISFVAAAKAYPNNFVYLCHTPETGTWLGSTPELLISGIGNQWLTVALAGTKPISERNNEWDNKNKVEQKIVESYIEEQLHKANCSNINKTEPNIIEAGDIIHLKSDFSFKLGQNSSIGHLLQLLHPTPAVCGYPKEEAFEYILHNEGYDRKYYSGFVGYLDNDGHTDLYVNLRCMEIKEKSLLLYAGGGLLPSSALESEWNETESKLQTIKSIVSDIQ